MAVRAWKLSLGLFVAVVAASCELAFPVETQNGAGPSGNLDAGDASGGSAGFGGSGGGGTCLPTPSQKFCGQQCESKQDPFYGCAATDCTPCSSVHGTPTCTNGACAITCSNGYGDCDNNSADGCEVDTNTDPYHCGSCGKNCFADTSSSNWECVGGACKPSKCAFGKADCAGTGTCKTDLTTDVNNCGSCGHACNIPNATSVCQPVTNPAPGQPPGVCAIAQCNTGYMDCNNSATDGCETNVQNGDPDNCGACGKKCPVTNGVPSCQNGACTIACQPGYADCDSNVTNGCETSLGNTTAHCGSCATACTNAHGSTSCSGGACHPVCSSGYSDCDGNLKNGCETDTSTDSNNCGACGKNCTGGMACQAGSCVCPPGQVVFNGTCCAPETIAAACSNQCNTNVQNNCGQTVSCGPCANAGEVCQSNLCCFPHDTLTADCTTSSDPCCSAGDTCHSSNGKCY